MRPSSRSLYETLYGIRASDEQDSLRVLAALLHRYTPARLAGEGQELQIIIGAPHCLVHSPVLAGLLRIAAALTPADRQAARIAASRAIERSYLLDDPSEATLRAILTMAARSPQTAVLESEGLVINLGRFKPAHRNLILSEVYFCFRPVEAPECFWRADELLGKHVAAGYRPRAFRPEKSAELISLGCDVGLEPRLFRMNGGPIFLGGQLFNEASLATAQIVRIITLLQKGTMNEAEEAVRLHGYASLSRSALAHIFSEAGRKLIQELTCSESRFMRREGDDTIISLAALHAMQQDPELQRTLKSRLSWMTPIALAMAYQSLRQPGEPEVLFLDTYFNDNRLRIGWRNAETLTLAEVSARIIEWERLTGTEVQLLHQNYPHPK